MREAYTTGKPPTVRAHAVPRDPVLQALESPRARQRPTPGGAVPRVMRTAAPQLPRGSRAGRVAGLSPSPTLSPSLDGTWLVGNDAASQDPLQPSLALPPAETRIRHPFGGRRPGPARRSVRGDPASGSRGGRPQAGGTAAPSRRRVPPDPGRPGVQGDQAEGAGRGRRAIESRPRESSQDPDGRTPAAEALAAPRRPRPGERMILRPARLDAASCTK